MPPHNHDHPEPDRFVSGTVGAPGQRAFYLQARSGRRVSTVGVEKQQVQLLATRVEELLDELKRRGLDPSGDQPDLADDHGPLETPFDQDFKVATMSLSWNPTRQRLVLECFAQGAGPESDPAEDPLAPLADGDTALRVQVSAMAARAFTRRSLALVAAGRPPCPFCSGPLDPAGHICPRSNGYRR